ncbi:DUF5947 family protein [Actinomadura vinacea]|uniref:DUF5947 family protein n=1 Tax=Actinomadura vinacea TaxID=115336 RepID=A0ABN3KA10_9ACTN
MSTGALERAIRRASAGDAAVPERCGLCDAPIGGAHAHLLDERDDDLLCACRACALLFEREAAGRGHYRLVPDRRIRLAGVRTADLGVPVGLAFFTVRPDGTVVARYPSPMGATEWSVDPAVWTAATAGCAELGSMRPAVEALLVSTVRNGRVRNADEQWLVPIDDCYRLVAVIKRSWTGLSGGRRVWDGVQAFFTGLAEHSDVTDETDRSEE